MPVNIGRGDQFSPEYRKLNPNHRIPAIFDHEPAGGGPLSVFESGAILFNLAEKTGKLWSQDLRSKYDVTQWSSGRWPTRDRDSERQGIFRRLGDREGDQSYAVRRFTDEANRLYGVLNRRCATGATLPETNSPLPI